jgi:hypothetical protein
MTWQTAAAIASALAAIAAIVVAVYTVRRTLWISAVIALEERFSRINHAKITNVSAWKSICDDDKLSDTATHLVFETFQFYHQAFVLHKRRALAPEDYEQWHNRLSADIKTFRAYRRWWLSEQKSFCCAWDADFVTLVSKLVADHESETNPTHGSGEVSHVNNR